MGHFNDENELQIDEKDNKNRKNRKILVNPQNVKYHKL